MMARIHIWSVMIYGNLQAEFMYSGHTHRYVTPFFGEIDLTLDKRLNVHSNTY